jgi:hypothetical protein
MLCAVALRLSSSGQWARNLEEANTHEDTHTGRRLIAAGLGVGNASDAVKVAQNTAGYVYKQNGVAVDGIYGAKTKAGVAYIHSRGGLAGKRQDGLCGLVTRGVTWVAGGYSICLVREVDQHHDCGIPACETGAGAMTAPANRTSSLEHRDCHAPVA